MGHRHWTALASIVSLALGSAGLAGAASDPGASGTSGGAGGGASQPQPDVPPPRIPVPGVVVTATRSEAESFDVPATVNTLDSQYLREEMVRTLPEAFRDTPGVMVQKTSNGQGSPYIRGFTSFRTLLLVDGVRINNSIMRPGPNQYWATIDPLTLQRIELVKGPTSVLYGSDAIGGTVNAITRSEDDFGPGFGWGGRTYYRYSTAEASDTSRAELSGHVSDRAGWLFGGSYKDYNDLYGGEHIGRQPKTGYEEGGFDGKLDLWSADSLIHFTVAGYAFHQDDVWRTHSTIYATNYQGTVAGSDLRRSFDQTHQLYYGRMDWSEVARFLDEAKLTISLQRTDEEEDRVRGSGDRTKQGLGVWTTGVDAELLSRTPVGTLTYGFDYYHDAVDSHRRDRKAGALAYSLRPRGPVADDATCDLLGIYLQDEYWVTEALQLIGGVRYTSAWANADDVAPKFGEEDAYDSIDKHFDSVVGSLAATWEFHPGLRVYGSAAMGFRAPNLSDLTRFDIARSGEVEVPTPDLEPEDYVQYEIGLKGRSERFEGDASWFYTLIRNQIERFPTGDTTDEGDPIVAKANVGDGWVTGVELDGRVHLGCGFSAFAWFSWIEGKVDTFAGDPPMKERDYLSRLQPTSGLVGVRWDSEGSRYYAQVTAHLVNEGRRLSPGDELDVQRIPPGGTTGYTIYDVSLGAKVGEWLELTTTFANVAGDSYRILGSGVNEAGFNFILGADLAF